jgi:SAM-dependent MidA family methyltransferase
MALSLYHPAVGYYRHARQRIGYGGETDFYTATTSGNVFGELIAAGAVTLLHGQDPGKFTFVEIGAEPAASILRNVTHPFRENKIIPCGQPITLAGRLVVFSNELFDAQPFRRFVRLGGRWAEIGVALRGDTLIETQRAGPPPSGLPLEAPDGYHLDVPWAARELMRQIASQPWQGLILACDYGKSWAEISTTHPNGTARAYHRHQQHNDLLARPGEQDLTCHICWDWLSEELVAQGFGGDTLESQETFFVRHSGEYIQNLVAQDAIHLTRRKLALTQLIHPAHLGQKFQVLHALRT